MKRLKLLSLPLRLSLLAVGMLCLLPLHAEANNQSLKYREMLDNQPTDPFINLLKRRINHNAFISFRTQRDGKNYIEASTIARYPVNEILGLYSDAFREENLPYDIHRSEHHDMVVFKGHIDGAEKRILLKPNPDNGNVIVRLYSEQFSHKFKSHFTSIYDLHPELKTLTGDRMSDNHYDHTVAHSGLIRLRVDGGNVEQSKHRLLDELEARGWRHDEASSRQDYSPVMTKGDSHMLITPATHTHNRTTFVLYIRHLETQ